MMLTFARRTLHNEDGWETAAARYLSRDPDLRVAILRECVWSVASDKVFESLEHIRDTCEALGATGADIREHLTNLEKERPRDWVRLWGELVRYGKVRGGMPRVIDFARMQGKRYPVLDAQLQVVLKSRRHSSLERDNAQILADREARRQKMFEFHGQCQAAASTIRKGENLPMLRVALDAYLGLSEMRHHENLLPRERVAHAMGTDLVPDVLAGIEAATLACADKMRARDIAAQSADWKFGDHALLLLAHCLERVQDNLDFRDFPSQMVESALAAFHLNLWAEKHPGYWAARTRLEDSIFASARKKTTYFRTILDPFTLSGRDLPPGVDLLLLAESHLASTREIAQEWLGKDTAMHEGLRGCLLTALLAENDRGKLLGLAHRLRAHAGYRDDVHGGLAFVLEFMHDFVGQRHRLRETAKRDRHSVFALSHSPVYTSCIGYWDAMSPAQSHFALSAYAAAWPRVHSTHFEWDEEKRKPWKASNFLLGRIRALGNDTSDDAKTLLRKLLKSGMMSSYSEEIRAAKETQDRLRKEMAGTPLEPGTVRRLLGTGPRVVVGARRVALRPGAQRAGVK